MKYSLLIICFLFTLFGFGQNTETVKALKILNTRGEAYLRFTIKNPLDINSLLNVISIDEKTTSGTNIIYAYVNKKQFQQFLRLNIPFETLSAPGVLMKNPKMLTSISDKSYTWDVYPTYQTYLDMMAQFQADYPNLCSVYHIGNSVMNRQIIFARLTSNVNSGQAKPRIMLTSTMHGDEPVGYVTLLRMIDYLLTNYGISTKISGLLDNYEIWINPLANPDGTFAAGNNTISGATRYNANAVDLNRNFPDFISGSNPDGNEWQPENIAMMHLADSLHFVVSVNIHSGQEVLNYPWDNQVVRHADESWWQNIAKNYADTVFVHSASGYFTSISNSGYTNGSDWYIINGGRQDYMNYFNYCREFTLEISIPKIPSGSDLPLYWEANYRSLINYIREASQGFNGIVTDSVTGYPLHATISINGHDADNSNVISELPYGNYYRPVFPGNYEVSIASSGYKTKTYPISIIGNSAISLNAQLSLGNSEADNSEQDNSFDIFPNPTTDLAYLKLNTTKQYVTKINLINLHGKIFDIAEKYVSTGIIEHDFSAYPKGIYFLQVINQHQSTIKKIVLN